MNLYYANPKDCSDNTLLLKGQEVKHASKVLRYREGDPIAVTDGQGYRYDGIIQSIRKSEVEVAVKEKTFEEPSERDVTLALGVIKKRDRLEFAVEKAVELGVNRIVLYYGDHTEKGKVRMDRVESTILSAMKQSLRNYLPKVDLYKSMDELMEVRSDAEFVVADQNSTNSELNLSHNSSEIVLLVGPEGGFSEREVKLWESESIKSTTVLLGDKRLRAETAAVVMVLKAAED